MKSINGTICFKMGDRQIELKVDNLIHLYDSKENGLYEINQTVTKDNVYILIESELKNKQFEGKLHDIKLFDGQKRLIAYCNNPKDNNKLIFNNENYEML